MFQEVHLEDLIIIIKLNYDPVVTGLFTKLSMKKFTYLLLLLVKETGTKSINRQKKESSNN